MTHVRGVSRGPDRRDWAERAEPTTCMSTVTAPTIAVSPAALYLARRSTPASRATATSALNAAARILGHADHTTLDWALDYSQAALIRAGLTAAEPGWAKVIWSATRQVTAEAHRLGLLDAQTTANIAALPAPRGSGGHRGRTPDDTEVGLLLEAAAADTTLRGRRDAAVIAILAGLGLRRAEASTLRADRDWNPGRRHLTVRSGKGRRHREIPAPEWAAELIDEWIATGDGSGPLLVGIDRWERRGGPLSGHALNEIVLRLTTAADLEPLTCHGLRRYAVSSLLRVADVGLAQRMAGHADVSTTLRSYDARGLDELDRAVRLRSRPGPR